MRTAAFLRLGLAVTTAVAMTAAFVPPAAADPGDLTPIVPVKPDGTPVPLVTGKWIVGLSKAPASQGGDVSQARAEQGTVLAQARDLGLAVTEDRSFTHAFNGLTIAATDADAARLRSVPGVTGVWPVYKVAAPDPIQHEPQLKTALALTGADIAQSELGYTGKGVKVGIIDSGIDVDHPDLGGGGTNGGTPFPSSRVKWGTDFVGDAYDANSDDPAVSTPKPDARPDDCGGHGTHVAGIVGASGDFSKGGVRGVAPEVEFGAYRVFGCDGSSDTEVILAAMDMAMSDGMDVVNMSLGASYMSWPSYPTAVAADNLSDAGVIMVVSAGNNGTNTSFSGSAPSVAAKAIAVASVENTKFKALTFTITPDGRQLPYQQAGGAPESPSSGDLELALAGPDSNGSANTACGQIGDVAGKAALISRGTCTFYSKALRAQQAGAKAVVLYNNAPGLLSPTVEGDVPITIPVVIVPQAEGLEIASRLASGPVTMTWTNEWATLDNPTKGLLSDFSSYGLAADLSLKPDITAPGGNIFSTYPLEKKGYTNMSGTSMAAPHASGAVALLLQAKPELRNQPALVRERLQATGDLASWSGNPTLGLLEPVHRQGGGVIQIDRAITSQHEIRPGKISMGEGPAAKTVAVTLTNNSDTAVTYGVSKKDGVATVGSIDPVMKFAMANAGMTGPLSVTVPAKGSASVRVTITPPTTPATGIYGGWVVFSSATSTLQVPYAGMIGDYQSVKVLSGAGLPAMAKLRDGEPAVVSPKATPVYTMREGDVPMLFVHLDYPADNLIVDVYSIDHLGRQVPVHARYGGWVQTGPIGKDAKYRTLRFTGTFDLVGGGKGLAPNGRYVFVVKAVKPMADLSNPEHTEVWTSQTFVINRNLV